MKIRERLWRLTAALSLLLSMLAPAIPVRAAVDTCVWTGAGSDDLFSNTDNWTGCDDNLPEAGDTLEFPATVAAEADRRPVNDTTLAYAGIVFTGATDSCNTDPYVWYVITGSSPLSLAGSITNNLSGSCNRVNLELDIEATGNITIDGTSTGGYMTIGESTGSDISTLALGSHGLTTSGSGYAAINSIISGTAGSSITANISTNLNGENTNFDGSITTTNSMGVSNPHGLGSSVGATTIGNNGSVNLSLGNGQDVAEDFIINNNNNNGSPSAAFLIGNVHTAATLSGDITLQTNLRVAIHKAFGATSAKLTHTGALSGSFSVIHTPGNSGIFSLDSDPNDSLTANGDLVSPRAEYTFTTNQAYGAWAPGNSQSTINSGVTVTGNSGAYIDGILINNGTITGDVTITDNAIFKGNGGTVSGEVSIEDTATMATGTSPGCMTVGGLTLVSGTTFEVEIQGVTECTEYDRTVVGGDVDLGDSTLDLQILSGFDGPAGSTYMIIENNGANPVTGTFDGLAEGATITAGGVEFTISYVGGNGNDVVLTQTGEAPGVPNTGFRLLLNNPLLMLATTLSATIALAYAARKMTV